MILDTEKADVSSVGFTETKLAEIKATPQMLRMLSSGIYSDKISAFIRELSTNAYDAMLEKGTLKDKSFYVHLPTPLEPWFSIRDFGTGLSHLGMETNFSNFGDGTKAGTNVYNGAFGLGSKSPLSYVRDFTIISYHNGTKTFYNYGKNEEDVPMLSTAFSEPSTEHSGLEITIAIESKDIQEVINKAELIYRYFDKRPETNIELQYQELKQIVKGDNWYLTEPDYRYGTRSTLTTPTRVVMGNVAYPVKFSYSDGDLQHLNSTPFVIIVGIGDVNITPSRETLEMTPKTKAFLEKKFKDIVREFSKDIEKSLDQSLSNYDKVVTAFAMMNTVPNCIKSIQIGKFSITRSNYDGVIMLPADSGIELQRVSKERSYYYKKTERYSNGYKFRPMNSMNYIYIIVDTNKRLSEITDKYKLFNEHIYFVRPITGAKANLDAQASAKFTKDYTKFLNDIGNPKYVLASTELSKLQPIVKLPRSAGSVKVQRATPVLPLMLVDFVNGARTIKTPAIQSTDTGPFFYIPIYRGDFKLYNGTCTWYVRECLKKIVRDVEEKLKDKIKLYAVEPRYLERVRKDSRFVEFTQYVKEQKFEYVLNVIDANVRHTIGGLYLSETVRTYMIANKGKYRLGEMLAAYVNSETLIQSYRSVYETCGYTISNSPKLEFKDAKEVCTKYEDLKYLQHGVKVKYIKMFLEEIEKENKNG